MNEVDPLYLSTAECRCCESPFQITRVRPSFKNPSRTDSDFCGHYNKGVNSDYYVIRVCPQCGYAFSENGLKTLTDEQKRVYYEQIGKYWKEQYFHGERTAEQALHTYKRALMIAQLLKDDPRVIAGFLHHIAWIYRELQDMENEQRFIKYALDEYIIVFEQETNSEKNARLLYLIGELNKRLGNYHEAIKWFSRVVHDQSIMDAGMIRASREQWKEISEKLSIEREERERQKKSEV